MTEDAAERPPTADAADDRPSGDEITAETPVVAAVDRANTDSPATDSAPVESAPVESAPTKARRRGRPKAAAKNLTPRQRRIKSAVEWLVVVAVALVVALGIRQFLFQPFWIPSGSMEDTLNVGDRVLVNKAAYRFHEVRRGDVVVFEQPDSWPLAPDVKDLIKRVVAIEGDEVTIRDCAVWLNGGKLIEPYVDDKCTEPATDVVDPDGDGAFTVPQDMLFVMGDNRTGSTDSRFNGFVPEDDVVGRAFVVIWPRSNWSWL
jgi:signal peptidase I